MKNVLKFSALALFVAVGAFIIAGINPSHIRAQEAEEPGQTEESSEQAEQSVDQNERSDEQKSPYTYTAQSGDSYTKIARKAVQTYGFNTQTDLSQAQIVAAETFLTSEAGFPSISEGEEVVISEEAVKAAVEKAQGLDDAATARWERYVPFVDFNTNSVGEAQSS